MAALRRRERNSPRCSSRLMRLPSTPPVPPGSEGGVSDDGAGAGVTGYGSAGAGAGASAAGIISVGGSVMMVLSDCAASSGMLR